jgi:hypothetical protein
MADQNFGAVGHVADDRSGKAIPNAGYFRHEGMILGNRHSLAGMLVSPARLAE